MLTFATRLARKFLDAESRRRVRRMIDPLSMPIGSIIGSLRQTDLVALTFDDGPDPDVTPRLLDLLRARGVQATFFVLTDKAARHRDVLRQIVDDGHEVALHFDRHDRLTRLPLSAVRRRLTESHVRLQEFAGPVRFFRPPFGAQSFATYCLARLRRLDVVMWGPYAADWEEQSAASAANRALATVRGGDIILLHDGLEKPPGEPMPTFDRVEMVDLILDGLDQRRLAAGSVGALIHGGGERRTAWFTA